jgi:hypothetical protein
MDGFNGWNGKDYGMPNISSVQDYDHGPTGTPISMAPGVRTLDFSTERYPQVAGMAKREGSD